VPNHHTILRSAADIDTRYSHNSWHPEWPQSPSLSCHQVPTHHVKSNGRAQGWLPWLYKRPLRSTDGSHGPWAAPAVAYSRPGRGSHTTRQCTALAGPSWMLSRRAHWCTRPELPSGRVWHRKALILRRICQPQCSGIKYLSAVVRRRYMQPNN
jgi:hypothetical protein